jgi:hypothetical protein
MAVERVMTARRKPAPATSGRWPRVSMMVRERGRCAFLLGVRRHEGGVDIEDDDLAEVDRQCRSGIQVSDA